MNRKPSSLYILLFIILFSGCSKRELAIYVSPNGADTNIGSIELPLQSIAKALELAKRKTSHTTIYLSDGDYHLKSPLQFDNKLSNTTLVGTGTDKVSIKGSEILQTNWEAYDQHIWVTDIKTDIEFDQLFLNGKEQILARYPNFDSNGGYWQGHAEDVISKERVATWKNPIGGFVHAMHKGEWGGFHYEITGIDATGDVILKGGHQNNRPSPMHPELRMVENVFEELDSPQEWYFDKQNKKLYLWAEQDIDLNKAVVEVSNLKHLIEIEGTSAETVKNVEIRGIKFEHTTRTFLEEYHQLLRSDWTIYRGGAISLNGTEDCTISDCEFTQLGGNVIFVNAYNRNTKISGNHIYNCGASAISFVGDTTAVRSPSYQYAEFVPYDQMDTIQGPANELYPSECLVENNLIHNIGRVEKQVAGVQISMAMKIHVKNNSIYEVPRAGINVSEGTWGGHIIEYNDVFDTVLESGDHGSFNSWGRDRFWHSNRKLIDSVVHLNPQMPYWDAMHTTTISNNRFRCNYGWDIDLDDGSSNYHIYNNLCLNGGIKLREGYYRVVENNIMVNNGFHPHVWFDNSEDVFRKNIMMTKHFDIRLQGWGKEVDFNLFPDSVSLALAQENHTDQNSKYGNPMFTNPEEGNYTIEEGSPAFDIGFKNFTMENFGVQKANLKAISRQPDIPQLNILSFQKVIPNTRDWLGATLKNIDSPEQQSALGLFDMNGVQIVELAKNSILFTSGIAKDDVITEVENTKVKSISELLGKVQENLWRGTVNLKIIRNQNELSLPVKLK